MSLQNARAAAAAVLALGAFGLLASACDRGREAEDPSDQEQYGSNAYGQQQPYGQPPPGQYQGYPQQQPGQYPQQQPGQYPQQQPGQAPAGAPASPLALPCQNDMICGTHRCNMQTQRCAFPCASTADCAAGFSCLGAGGPTAICVPGAGQ